MIPRRKEACVIILTKKVESNDMCMWPVQYQPALFIVIALAYTQGCKRPRKRRVVNGQLHFREEPCATLCASWELIWIRIESCKQLLVLKTLFFGRNIPTKIRFHLHPTIHPSHPNLPNIGLAENSKTFLNVHVMNAFRWIPRIVEARFLVNLGHDLWGNLGGIFVASQTKMTHLWRRRKTKKRKV